jgi:hypothetical protein
LLRAHEFVNGSELSIVSSPATMAADIGARWRVAVAPGQARVDRQRGTCCLAGLIRIVHTPVLERSHRCNDPIAHPLRST